MVVSPGRGFSNRDFEAMVTFVTLSPEVPCVRDSASMWRLGKVYGAMKPERKYIADTLPRPRARCLHRRLSPLSLGLRSGFGAPSELGCAEDRQTSGSLPNFPPNGEASDDISFLGFDVEQASVHMVAPRLAK